MKVINCKMISIIKQRTFERIRCEIVKNSQKKKKKKKKTSPQNHSTKHITNLTMSINLLFIVLKGFAQKIEVFKIQFCAFFFFFLHQISLINY